MGDSVVSVDGVPIHDILDWRWHTAEDVAKVTLRSPLGDLREVSLSREPGVAWGMDFDDPLFDGVRTCRNSCAFCFMTQLPRGMRAPLYVRDDDYRLSFLQGNFVTLTNLSDADVERILEQRLSPLHVSLHAVDSDVRAELICARHDDGLQRLDELLQGGIDVHVQIVAVPGINDGEVLERSLRWLAEREGVESVGIVPLGFTGHQTRFVSSYEDPEAAAALLDQVEPWHRAFRERDGVGWVYAADEFYLNAARPIPSGDDYDGFPQYENGIGMVRAFIDEFTAEMDEPKHGDHVHERLVFVTGVAFAAVFERLLASGAHGSAADVLAVHNEFFGGNVNVTGLLTGRDIVRAIKGMESDAVHVIPEVVFNSDGVTLDEMTADDIARQSGAHVRVVCCDAAGAAGALLGRSIFDSKNR